MTFLKTFGATLHEHQDCEAALRRSKSSRKARPHTGPVGTEIVRDTRSKVELLNVLASRFVMLLLFFERKCLVITLLVFYLLFVMLFQILE